ncbi:GIY-YIG nuclease family protein [Porticoccaceae bacterium LTM1]|nr:GIY-YIG nuclease family protein [Porticoccaceae bacterium LTM1]
MIVFTIINEVTDQVYVATTGKTPKARWKQFVDAASLGIKAKIYDDILEHGAESFSVAEFGVAMDREHSRELLDEAMEQYDAISLQGVKTSLDTIVGETPVRKATPAKAPKPSSMDLVKQALMSAGTTGTAVVSQAKTAAKPKKAAAPKISTGRAASSSKEKRIKELIAQEKLARETAQKAKASAEADEMAAIMAKIDSRATSSYRRGR